MHRKQDGMEAKLHKHNLITGWKCG